jgi:hypothetical protein
MIRSAMVMAFIILWALSPPPSAIAASQDESQVKAVMVLNIAKFVDWPATSLPPERAPFMICVIGKGEFAQAVESLTGKTVKGRAVVVRRVARNDLLDACQVLVVGESEQRRVPAILGSTGRYSMLTISDLPGFARSGGGLGLIEREGKIRMEINLEAARHSRITINSHLLKLATIIQ